MQKPVITVQHQNTILLSELNLCPLKAWKVNYFGGLMHKSGFENRNKKLSNTHLSMLIRLRETVILGSPRICAIRAKPSAATQRSRGLELSSAPNRRESAGFCTSSGPSVTFPNAKHWREEDKKRAFKHTRRVKVSKIKIFL